jgi:hypothetical protein
VSEKLNTNEVVQPLIFVFTATCFGAMNHHCALLCKNLNIIYVYIHKHLHCALSVELDLTSLQIY